VAKHHPIVKLPHKARSDIEQVIGLFRFFGYLHGRMIVAPCTRSRETDGG
jgi:hypothetical protein